MSDTTPTYDILLDNGETVTLEGVNLSLETINKLRMILNNPELKVIQEPFRLSHDDSWADDSLLGGCGHS